MSCQGEEDVHLPQKNASASKAGSYASPASQTPSLQGTKGCYEAPRGLGDIHKIWIMDYCKKNWMETLRWIRWEIFTWTLEKIREGCWEVWHGGGDYFVIREFIDSILQGRTPRIGVYKALDFTLPGLMSRYSCTREGKPVSIPNPRDFWSKIS